MAVKTTPTKKDWEDEEMKTCAVLLLGLLICGRVENRIMKSKRDEY
jgi:hypothetical protein